jgi:hypothetical protein
MRAPQRAGAGGENDTLLLEYAGGVLFTLKMLAEHAENGSTSSLRVIFHPVA